MARPFEKMAFGVDARSGPVQAMDDLAAAHGGWINFLPDVPPEEEPPPPSPLTALFSSDVHVVPVCTWVPGAQARSGVRPDSIGVQHATGPKAIPRLASLGVPLPDGWRWTQDHPRRGIVVHPSPAAAHAEVLDWLLRAASALCPIRLTGDWTAEVHRPR